jgi:hypothetical protein
MKAERRHELQTNALALWLSIKGPELWNKYGNHVLVGLILIVAAIWLIRWRLQAPVIARHEAVTILTDVETALQRAMLDPNTQGLSDATVRIAQAIDRTEDKDVRGLAYVLLGDYHWLSPQIATIKPTGEALAKSYADATAAYEAALGSGSAQVQIRLRAHMGLGMLAEQQAYERSRQRGSANNPATDDPLWDEARKHYEAVAQDPKVSEPFHRVARERIEALPQLLKPVWIEKPPVRPLAEFGPLGPIPPSTAPAFGTGFELFPGTGAEFKPGTGFELFPGGARPTTQPAP